MTEQAEVAPLV